MSSTFNREWEQAVETRFAREQELRFRIVARRDKLFTAWAAERVRLSEPERDGLLGAVLHLPDGLGHDAAVLRLVGAALAERGAAVSDVELAGALADCLNLAKHQLGGEHAVGSTPAAP